MDKRHLCVASEKGKVIVNKCLDNEFFINTLKLEKLLILVHGTMLAIYQEPFFNQLVTAHPQGLMIEEVDRDFITFAVQFKEKFPDYICLLEKEEVVVDYIIKKYGSFNVASLNELPVLKILKGLCYSEYIRNTVRQDLIKNIFIEYGFDSIIKGNTSVFQKNK